MKTEDQERFVRRYSQIIADNITNTSSFPRRRESSIFMFLLLPILILFQFSCSEFKKKPCQDAIKKGCYSFEIKPPTNIGETISFTFIIEDIEKKSLHMDFVDNTYGYFDSLEVRVTNPIEWKDMRFSIYFQGKPIHKNKILKVGDSFKLVEEVPSCIKTLWLFLPYENKQLKP